MSTLNEIPRLLRKLQGKVAVITGATTGIGLAAEKLFVREGAYVFITGRRQKELDEAVKAIGSNVRSWTVELKDRRIRSNVLSPGPTETPVIGQQPADAIARIVSTIPMGRMGEPDEIAKTALFLASDDSSFVTGIELFVDGGRAQI